MIMKNYKYWLPSIVWAASIIVASLASVRNLKKFRIEGLFELDKLIHFTMYFGLSIFLSIGFYYAQKIESKGRLFLYSFILSSSLGTILEVLQKVITESRSFDYYDIIANIIGALIGSALFLIRIK